MLLLLRPTPLKKPTPRLIRPNPRKLLSYPSVVHLRQPNWLLVREFCDLEPSFTLFLSRFVLPVL